MKNLAFCRMAFGEYSAGYIHDRCGGRGFTLLEVMISLAIVAGLLVTLIYTLNYHLGIANRQVIITTATLLAKEKMYEIQDNPDTGKGLFKEPYADYSYETSARDSGFPGMTEIAVVVRNGKENVTLSRLIEKKNAKK